MRSACVILFSYTADVERVCAAAMRSCYSKFPAFDLYRRQQEEGKAEGEAPLDQPRIRKLIHTALKMGHESVLEHGLFTFDLQGISRACTHQLVRHRIASFSQQSQRHVRITPETDWYVVPPTLDDDSRRRFEDRMRTSASWYLEDSKHGRRIEDARFYLPNAARTNIAVSMNPRELLHVFRVRCAAEAQWEIRAAAWAMLACSKLIAPNIFHRVSDSATNSYIEEREVKLGRVLEELRPRFEKIELGETLEIPLKDLNLQSEIRALVCKH